MAEKEQKTIDPLDLSADLLQDTLGNLEQMSLDAERREIVRNMLDVVKATALMDIANSLRSLKRHFL